MPRSKECAHFLYKVWEEAGCPVLDVLFQIKKNAKSRYNYEVHQLKRGQDVFRKILLSCSPEKINQGFGRRAISLKGMWQYIRAKFRIVTKYGTKQ